MRSSVPVFFTALNDGLTSALISFLRTLVFQMAAILILPLIWGIDGIWISIVVAEFMAVVLTVMFLISKTEEVSLLSFRTAAGNTRTQVIRLCLPFAIHGHDNCTSDETFSAYHTKMLYR